MNAKINKVRLTATQQMDLTRAIQTIEQLDQQMRDLESCGRNCDSDRVALQLARQQAQNLLNKFAPIANTDE